jgi:hypothetical protein
VTAAAAPSNAFDDLPASTIPAASAAAAAPPAQGGNAFDDITPPAKPTTPTRPGATAADRVQAAEGGIIKGAAYTAGLIPDTILNLGSLGTAVADAARHYIGGTDWADLPRPSNLSPVGGALTKLADQSPITTTQPTRPDDAASRYLNTAGTVVPAIAAGGGGATQLAGAFTKAAVPAMAGQYVAEAKPFQSDAANNAASVLTQALGTAVMPGRSPGTENPHAAVINQTVRNAQEAGYVIPAGTTNPTQFNRSVEGFAGTGNVAQHATLRNQAVTNQAGRSALDLDGTGPISDAELAQVRADARPAYQAIRGAGTITQDPQLAADLAKATSKFSGASQLSSSLGKNDLEPIVKDITSKPTFDAGDALDAVGVLRDKAKAAFQAGDAGNGTAYRAASDAIENQIDRSLSSQPGSANSDLITNYREQRQRLAIAHTIEDSQLEGSNNISARKLAQALNAGAPLQGDLLTAARAANVAPKAFADTTSTIATGSHNGLLSLFAGGELAHQFLPESLSHYALAVPAAVGVYKGAKAVAGKAALDWNNPLQMAPAQTDPSVLAAALLSQQARQHP